MKRPDLLNRLPSVSELLEKPPVRALADRWNRSAVSGSVRKFLEEVADDLRRRSADVQLPSIRELAERAARYVASQQNASAGSAINATGRLWGDPWQTTPLADVALERMIAAGREFGLRSKDRHRASEPAASPICRVTGAEAALVLHSHSAAVWLALRTLAADREVLIARSEVGELAGGGSVLEVARSAGVALREVGLANRTSESDYRDGLSDRTKAILKAVPESYRVSGETSQATVEELARLAQERRVPLVLLAGLAPLDEWPDSLVQMPRSMRAYVEAGVDLVVGRGDGFLGGPPCGLILGRSALVSQISDDPLCDALHVDSLRLAALAAMVDGRNASPTNSILQLINAPIDNLRNRAERMATQLGQMSDVSSAKPVATRTQLVPHSDRELESFGVALTPSDGDVAALEQRLRRCTPPIVGRGEPEWLLLDLRSVFPRQDKELVDTLLEVRGQEAAENSHEGDGTVTQQ